MPSRIFLTFAAVASLVDASEAYEIPQHTSPALLLPHRSPERPDAFFTLRSARHHVEFEVSQVRWTDPPTGAQVIQTFPGASPGVKPVGGPEAPGVVNLVLGQDPSAWKRHLKPLQSLSYPQLYPGIDLIYLHSGMREGTLKREFHLEAGADPSQIRLTYTGATLSLSPTGDLLIALGHATLQEDAPVAWQDTPNGERRSIEAAYEILSPDTARFRLGKTDPTLPLVIDPPVRLVKTFGGSGNDTAFAVAATATHIYIVGTTASTDFPVTDGSTQSGDPEGIGDMLVAKLDYDGTLVWATYLGGNATDFPNGIALSPDESILTVSGWTKSGATFPSMNSVGLAGGAKSDCAIVQFDSEGNLLSSSRFGGAEDDQFAAVAWVPGLPGYAFTGFTNSTDFPFPAVNGADADTTKASSADLDALILVMTADRTIPLASYHGKGGNEIGLAVCAGEGQSKFAVTGWTDDQEFYKQSGDIALGGRDYFITGFTETGAREFAKLRGGTGDDIGRGISNGSSGLVVVGDTTSTDLPLGNSGARPQTTYGGGATDGFIHAFSLGSVTSSGIASYYGGSGADSLRSVRHAPDRRYVQVAGVTDSVDLTTADAPQTELGGGTDGIIGTFFASFASPRTIETRFLTYLGGATDDAFTAVDTVLDDEPPFGEIPPRLWYPLAVGAEVKEVTTGAVQSRGAPLQMRRMELTSGFPDPLGDFIDAGRFAAIGQAREDKMVEVDLAVELGPAVLVLEGAHEDFRWELPVTVTNLDLDYDAHDVHLNWNFGLPGVYVVKPVTAPELTFSFVSPPNVPNPDWGWLDNPSSYSVIPKNESRTFTLTIAVVNGSTQPSEIFVKVHSTEEEDPDPANNSASRFLDATEELSLLRPSSHSVPDQNGSDQFTQVILDPVSLGQGSLIFSLPLLDLGGPAALGASLHYDSDLPRLLPQSANQERALLTPNFWLEPYAIMVPYVELGADDFYTVVQFGSGGAQWFHKAGGVWQLASGVPPGGIKPFVESPIPYQLVETDNRMWMIDPERDMVYEFALGLGSAQLLRVHDRNGNLLEFGYPAGKARPTSISDGLGRQLQLSYTAGPNSNFEFLSSLSDGTRTWTFSYDPAAADNLNDFSLRSLTDPETGVLTIHYGALTGAPLHGITSMDLPRGNTPNSNVYNKILWNGGTRRRVVSQTSADGNTVTIDYDVSKPEVTVTEPDDGETVYGMFDEDAPLKRMTDPEGKTTSQTRNGQNQITSRTTPAADTTSNTFHAPTGRIASVTNPLGQTTTFTHTAVTQNFDDFVKSGTNQITVTFHNITRIDYPNGSSESFEYDGHGNVLRAIDPREQATHFTYNSRGQVLTVTNPAGGVTSFTYNADGTMATSDSSATAPIAYGYDATWRLIQISLPVPDGEPADLYQFTHDKLDRIKQTIDPEGRTRSLNFDSNGNLISSTNGAGDTVQQTQDSMDRRSSVTDEAGETTAYGYDNMGNLASITDATGVPIGFGYDSLRRPTSVTVAGATFTRDYDSSTRTLGFANPLGHRTVLELDPLLRPASRINPLGQERQFAYDAVGNLVRATDPLSQSTHFHYDSARDLTGVTLRDTLGNTVGQTTYGRDAFGRLNAISDLNGAAWNTAFTPEGRLQGLTDPLGNTTMRAYDDERGRLRTISLANGETLTYSHDGSDRIVAVDGSDGTALTFTHDNEGRLASATPYALAYDPRGLPASSTIGGAEAYTATHDAAGRLKTLSYNAGAVVITYVYDAITGLLTGVSDSLGAGSMSFTYDAALRVATRTRGNGLVTSDRYDAAGRLLQRTDAVTEVHLTYDAAGRIVTSSLIAPLDPENLIAASDESFDYDAASQVSSTGYAYDAVGRRIGDPGHTYGYDSLSRLVTLDGAPLAYDAFGNLLSAGARHYRYHFALPLAPMVAEFEGATPLRYYVHDPAGHLLYGIDVSAASPSAFYYHFDQVGTTLALTDAAGAVTDDYAHEPYGRLLGHTGASEQPFTFNGQFGVHRHGDLLNMRARWYDPRTAAFLSREPIWPTLAQPRLLNPYAFTLRDPSRRVDATGLKPEVVSVGGADPLALFAAMMTLNRYTNVPPLSDPTRELVMLALQGAAEDDDALIAKGPPPLVSVQPEVGGQGEAARGSDWTYSNLYTSAQCRDRTTISRNVGTFSTDNFRSEGMQNAHSGGVFEGLRLESGEADTIAGQPSSGTRSEIDDRIGGYLLNRKQGSALGVVEIPRPAELSLREADDNSVSQIGGGIFTDQP